MMIASAGRPCFSAMKTALSVAALALCLGGCATQLSNPFSSQPQAPAEPPPAPEIPASIRAEELIGAWGLAAYHKPDDRVRTEKNAAGQCKQPYVIGRGESGGVIMHLADEAQPQELRLKGSPSGKNYIGPPGPPPGEKDREIVSFDGRVLITRFIDPDAGRRYGSMIYVRCGPRA